MLDKSKTIHTIDCHYIQDELACAYLMIEGSESLFIENNTNRAVPYLLETLKEVGLEKESVKYIIITHVHLDHAGGTSALLKECPNAIVLAHPRAAPHIINPERLIKSATMVYGKETFDSLYGVIEPVPKEKVRVMEDGEVLRFGTRDLKFVFTRGHANHHFVIFDSLSEGVFTGDSFGIAYPALQNGNEPFLFPTTTPTDFDPEEALLSLDKIENLQPGSAFLTHFGEWKNMSMGLSQMRYGLKAMKSILDDAIQSRLGDERLIGVCLQGVNEFITGELNRRDIQLTAEEWKMVKLDIRINAMGIAHTAKRIRKKNLIKS